MTILEKLKKHMDCRRRRSTPKPVTVDLFRKSWHKKISPLMWRIPILVWGLGTISWSMARFWGPPEKYFLYMTHWGLLLICIESAFGVLVAAKKPPAKDPEDATFGLPWHVRVYWFLYNITIPVAFLITVFYWGILKRSSKKVSYAPNPVLDVMIHGVNSLAMLTELVLSAHPTRLLHIIQPLFFAGAYMLFTILFYLAGGTDPWGNRFVYPVIDWSKPQKTTVVVTMTAFFIALMYLLVLGIATLRDYIAERCTKKPPVYKDAFSTCQTI